MKKLLCLLISATIVTTGCATGGGRPGRGVGADYTPIVDTKNVNQETLNTDIAECRVYANQISPIDNAAGAAVAGAIFLGVLSAAVGGRSQMNRYNAVGGAIGAGAGAAAGSLAAQQNIIRRCLMGRGYTVLG